MFVCKKSKIFLSIVKLYVYVKFFNVETNQDPKIMNQGQCYDNIFSQIYAKKNIMIILFQKLALRQKNRQYFANFFSENI
jgi:hypothetical protein